MIIIVKITLHFKVVKSMKKKLELYEFFKRSAEDTVNLKVSDKQTCTVIYLYSNFNQRKMVYHLWGLVACYLRILNMPYVHC